MHPVRLPHYSLMFSDLNVVYVSMQTHRTDYRSSGIRQSLC